MGTNIGLKPRFQDLHHQALACMYLQLPTLAGKAEEGMQSRDCGSFEGIVSARDDACKAKGGAWALGGTDELGSPVSSPLAKGRLTGCAR